MSSGNENPSVALLKRDLAAGRINRREFLRYAVLVGMAAPAAYAFVGEPLGAGRAAAAAMPQGGTLRVGTQVKSLDESGDLFLGRLRLQCHPPGVRIPDAYRPKQHHPSLSAGEVGRSAGPQDLDAALSARASSGTTARISPPTT